MGLPPDLLSTEIAADPPLRPMTPALVATAIALLLGMVPVTTDLYLPALPTLQRGLGASSGSAQLTLTVLIACFGVGQLVWGPLSDRWGRRLVLLVGLAIYTLAGLLCAAASSIEALIGWRALEGVALAAAVTWGRAVVGDLYTRTEGARVMARAFGGLGLIAMTGPIAGGLLVEAFGWRSALIANSAFGAATLTFVAWRLRETLAERDPSALQPSALLRKWDRLLAHRGFRVWTSLLCLTWAGLFFLVAASPFVYVEILGVSKLGYAVILSASAFAYIVGTLVCQWLLRRHGLRETAQRGVWAILVGGVLLCILTGSDVGGIWPVLLPQLLFALGYGVVQPCAQTAVVSSLSAMSGTASSLSGFALMSTASLVGLVLAAAGPALLSTLAVGVGLSALCSAVVSWALIDRED